MRWMFSGLVLPAVIGAMLLVPGSAGADGEEGKEYWLFQVRVVRTSCDAKSGLTPSPWEEQGPIVTTGWPEILQQLQKRGSVAVLMDDRVTSATGNEALLTTDKNYPLTTLQSQVVENQVEECRTLLGTTAKSGCRVKLLVFSDDLQYEINVNWFVWPIRSAPPPRAQTTWVGSIRPLEEGETLVLQSRQHVRNKDGEQETAEIYAFLSGRRVR